MIRFIVEKSYRYQNGCEGSLLYTIDGDLNLLEERLTSGGMSEDSYERHQLIGIEIVKD